MDLNIENPFQNCIDRIINIFGCNLYEAEKIYNDVRLELVILSERLDKKWSNEKYNKLTHFLINIQIQDIDNPKQYDNIDDISDRLRTISPDLINKITEMS